SQWTSFCRCNRVYKPGSQFSIDICANCKMRVASDATAATNCPGLCSCASPAPKKVSTYIKQNETDPDALDLSSVGMTTENFQVDRYTPICYLGDGARATTVLARDKQRGNKVAVKCFKRIAPTLKPTFESEVRKNKELNHTNIAKIVDFAFPNGKPPYLVT